MFALAHATGKSGRFTLIERWRNNEKQLAPNENPMKVFHKYYNYIKIIQSLTNQQFTSMLDSHEMG